MICVSENELDIILDIIKTYAQNYEVWAFGSRYKWTSKDYSDLDLAVVGAKKLPKGVIDNLKQAFEESELPFRVDVLDYNAMSNEFQEIISSGYEIIYSGDLM
jgi:predicted nucleotidyltransferase